MEVFVEKINEKEIVFPKNFKYTKTNDGFILDTLSGIEFFKSGIEDKISGIGNSILVICFILFLIHIFFIQNNLLSFLFRNL